MSNLMRTSTVIVHEGQVRVNIPVSKVDGEKRMVHGFATLDNLDLQGDIIPFETSMKSFSAFRGNIREMHDPLKAVGKMVSFKPEQLYDPETNKMYQGVFVSAYVSKGAQDTWEKVLDGTLSGFSVGGYVTESDDIYHPESNTMVHVIKEMELVELSLVDTPANQYANVISVDKTRTDSGYLAKTQSSNVFWCRKDNVVQITESPSASCYECNAAMQNIGFVENNDADKRDVVKALLADVRNAPEVDDYVDYDEGIGLVEQVYTSGQIKLKSADETLLATESDPVAIVRVCIKKDDTMNTVNRRIMKNISSLKKMREGEKEVEKVDSPETGVIEVNDVVEAEEVEKTIVAEPVVVAEAAAEEVVVEPEVAVEAEEAQDETEPVVEAAVETDSEPKSNDSDLSAKVAELTGLVGQLVEAFKSVPEAVKSLGGAVESVTKDVSAIKSEMESQKEEFGKRVDSVEKTTAFRKSADLGEVVQEPPVQVEKSIWGGRFLDNATNFN